MKEEELLKRRILDLANRSFRSGIYTFSGFMSAGDQAQIYDMEKELRFVPWTFFGGDEDCERRMLRFGSEETLGYTEAFPISCLVVKPQAPKFADALTHRDFLGALMHLGIERDVLGDIIVKDNIGYIFCEDGMAVFLQEELTRVRHTSVSCTITRECPTAATREYAEEELVVSAPRCDSIIAKAFQLSRSQSIRLFQGGRVFLNGRLMENNSGALKPGDIISARGFGKFVFDGELKETKKGRIRVRIRRYR